MTHDNIGIPNMSLSFTSDRNEKVKHYIKVKDSLTRDLKVFCG